MSRPFDEAELLQRIDNDWGFLADAVDMLRDDGRELLASIRTSAAAGDAAAVKRDAHTLKGMVSNFCSPETYDAAFALERMGMQGDLSASNYGLVALEAKLESLIGALTELLATRA